MPLKCSFAHTSSSDDKTAVEFLPLWLQAALVVLLFAFLHCSLIFHCCTHVNMLASIYIHICIQLYTLFTMTVLLSTQLIFPSTLLPLSLHPRSAHATIAPFLLFLYFNTFFRTQITCLCFKWCMSHTHAHVHRLHLKCIGRHVQIHAFIFLLILKLFSTTVGEKRRMRSWPQVVSASYYLFIVIFYLFFPFRCVFVLCIYSYFYLLCEIMKNFLFAFSHAT